TVSNREEFDNSRPSCRVSSHEKVSDNKNSKENDFGSKEGPDSQLNVWDFSERPTFNVAFLVNRESLAAVAIQRDYPQYCPIRDKRPERLVANRAWTAWLSNTESEEKEESRERHDYRPWTHSFQVRICEAVSRFRVINVS